MRALVIVHTEDCYIDPKLNGNAKMLENCRWLFPAIGNRLPTWEHRYDKIYALESDQNSSMHASIKKNFAGEVIPSRKDNPAQFLEAKRQILEEGASLVHLVGVESMQCLTALNYLFNARMPPKPPYELDYLNSAEVILGWSEDEFFKVYNAQIPTRVRPFFTDGYNHVPSGAIGTMRKRINPLHPIQQH